MKTNKTRQIININHSGHSRSRVPFFCSNFPVTVKRFNHARVVLLRLTYYKYRKNMKVDPRHVLRFTGDGFHFVRSTINYRRFKRITLSFFLKQKYTHISYLVSTETNSPVDVDIFLNENVRWVFRPYLLNQLACPLKGNCPWNGHGETGRVLFSHPTPSESYLYIGTFVSRRRDYSFRLRYDRVCTRLMFVQKKKKTTTEYYNARPFERIRENKRNVFRITDAKLRNHDNGERFSCTSNIERVYPKRLTYASTIKDVT